MNMFNKGKNNTTDKKIIIIEDRCPKNHSCPSVKICPVNALTQNNFDAPMVDLSKCVKCGKCVSFCPKKALVLE